MLVAAADRGVEPGVIGAGRAAGLRERLGEFFGGGAGLGVDDAGAGLRGDEVGDLAGGVVARGDRVADVGAIESRDDHAVARDAELVEDIGAGDCVGGGGEREAGDFGEGVEQRAEETIVGAEIVAPFADAMRFVDREEAEFGLG